LIFRADENKSMGREQFALRFSENITPYRSLSLSSSAPGEIGQGQSGELKASVR
jgi:hypothetical protein